MALVLPVRLLKYNKVSWQSTSCHEWDMSRILSVLSVECRGITLKYAADFSSKNFMIHLK